MQKSKNSLGSNPDLESNTIYNIKKDIRTNVIDEVKNFDIKKSLVMESSELIDPKIQNHTKRPNGVPPIKIRQESRANTSPDIQNELAQQNSESKNCIGFGDGTHGLKTPEKNGLQSSDAKTKITDFQKRRTTS